MGDLTSKYDKSPIDRFLRPLGNPRIVAPFSAAVLIAGLVVSSCLRDWSWFSRAGYFVSTFGLLLTMSPVFSRGIYLSQAQSFGFSEKDEDGKNRRTWPEDHKIGIAVLLGVIIAVIGTIIGAFGDLIG